MFPHSYRDGHYEVVHAEVPVLVAPSTEALEIGHVREGKHLCGDAYNVGGKPWLRLDDGTVKELAHDKILDPHKHSGSAFILIQGRTVGLGELLRWLGPPDMSFSPGQASSVSALTCRAEASSPSKVPQQHDARKAPAALAVDNVALSLKETPRLPQGDDEAVEMKANSSQATPIMTPVATQTVVRPIESARESTGSHHEAPCSAPYTAAELSPGTSVVHGKSIMQEKEKRLMRKYNQLVANVYLKGLYRSSGGCCARSAPAARLLGQMVAIFRTCKDVDSERMNLIDIQPLEEDMSEFNNHAAVFVSPADEVGKPWMGFGGSFTEAAATVFHQLSPEQQETVLQVYFNPELTEGHGYSLGRVHIGSCDFSLSNWCCGDIPPGDMDLKGFSLSRYDEKIVPMIRRAAEVAGAQLTLVASPWSPPMWMKTGKAYSGEDGGSLRPECRRTWAKHFVRFIEEMNKRGIKIWGISVQNETEGATRWEGCLYRAEEERDFVRDYLGPAITSAFDDVKILIWDHNRDGMVERAAIAYEDPEAAKYMWGMAYHWYGDARYEHWPEASRVLLGPSQYRSRPFEVRSQVRFDNLRRVAELRPDKHILQTESCQELGEQALATRLDEWTYGERYAMNLITDMNNGCEGWIDWNLILNEEGGPNHARNFCVAPIIFDRRRRELLYQPAYYFIGHFARFIKPGARRVVCSSTRDILEAVAYINLDRSIAIVVLNQSEDHMGFWLKVLGAGAKLVEAPAHSITTFFLSEGESEE